MKYKKSEKTRRFIIERTAQIFNKKGYAGTSLSDLTEATGLTKGSIYGNFKNKDEVATEAFKYNIKKLFEPYGQELEKVTNSIDKLKVFIQVQKQLFPEINTNGGCPLLNTATEADDTHDLLKAISQKAINEWKKSMISIIETGKMNSEIREDISADKYSGMIISLIEGAAMLAKITGKDNYFYDALDQLNKIIDNEMKK